MDFDWKYLLTSFEGRINRKPYWIGAGILVVVWLVLFFAGWAVFGDAVGGAPVYILQLLFLYPAAALLVKRLHDRNRPTYFIAFWLVPAAFSALLGLFGLSDPLDPSVLDMIISFIMMIVGIWFLVELGFLKGTAGPNRFGADPLAAHRTDPSMASP
jgi:uncharacterized membrane protein YhaH (DUF805 family)